jgi:hypothetical protein
MGIATCPLSRFSTLVFEFLKCFVVAILWVAVFAFLLAGFGDYEPASFTVHASTEARR